MIGLTAAALALSLSADVAKTIQGECTPAELKMLKSPAIVTQFVVKGQVVHQDCSPAAISPERQVLVVVQVFNTAGGYESYLSIFERKNFTESSAAIFKSFMLGFDVFPLQVVKTNRLFFVHPNSDKSKIVLYMNVQSSPNSSKLARWELALDKFVLTEVVGRGWPIEAGVLPKIYDDHGVLRALMESRAVEL